MTLLFFVFTYDPFKISAFYPFKQDILKKSVQAIAMKLDRLIVNDE